MERKRFFLTVMSTHLRLKGIDQKRGERLWQREDTVRAPRVEWP